MALTRRLLVSVLVLAGVSGCGPSYSPDTYASNAAQQANKVEQGVVVGVRTVGVSAAGTVGTVTGAAAGGIAGSQVAAGPVSAFTALGGSLVGGIAGSTVEHATADTTAFEYIVRKPNGDLISVTQKDKTPLVLGQKVLVIVGNQARVVADYTVPPPAKPVESAKATEPVKADATASEPKSADAKPPEAKPPEATQAGPTQTGPTQAGPIETATQPAEAKTVVPTQTEPTRTERMETAAQPADTKPAAPAQDDKPVVPAKPADSSTP